PMTGDAQHYVLAVAVSPAEIQTLLMENLLNDQVGAIVDRQGRFIARSLKIEDMIGTPATKYVREAIQKGKEGIYEGVTYEGFKNYTVFHTSALTGWSPHIALDTSLIDRPRIWSFIIAAGSGILI